MTGINYSALPNVVNDASGRFSMIDAEGNRPDHSRSQTPLMLNHGDTSITPTNSPPIRLR